MEKDNNTNIFKWNKLFDEKKFLKKPWIIHYFLEINKNYGIEYIEDLKYLDKINK